MITKQEWIFKSSWDVACVWLTVMGGCVGRERAESRGHDSRKRGGETLLHLRCCFTCLFLCVAFFKTCKYQVHWLNLMWEQQTQHTNKKHHDITMLQGIICELTNGKHVVFWYASNYHKLAINVTRKNVCFLMQWFIETVLLILNEWLISHC